MHKQIAGASGCMCVYEWILWDFHKAENERFHGTGPSITRWFRVRLCWFGTLSTYIQQISAYATPSTSHFSHHSFSLSGFISRFSQTFFDSETREKRIERFFHSDFPNRVILWKNVESGSWRSRDSLILFYTCESEMEDFSLTINGFLA